jgi:hypothetical protein
MTLFAFGGDLAGVPSIPWDKILNIMEEKKYDRLAGNSMEISQLPDINKIEREGYSHQRSEDPSSLLYYKIFETTGLLFPLNCLLFAGYLSRPSLMKSGCTIISFSIIHCFGPHF